MSKSQIVITDILESPSYAGIDDMFSSQVKQCSSPEANFCSGSSRSDFSCIRHWKVFSLTYEASGMIFGRHARVFLTASSTHTVLDPRLHSDCARPSSYQFVKIVSVGSGRISRGPAGFSATTTNRILKVTVILWSFTNASRGEETWKSFIIAGVRSAGE